LSFRVSKFWAFLPFRADKLALLSSELFFKGSRILFSEKQETFCVSWPKERRMGPRS
jgi:hypothetical protein